MYKIRYQRAYFLNLELFCLLKTESIVATEKKCKLGTHMFPFGQLFVLEISWVRKLIWKKKQQKIKNKKIVLYFFLLKKHQCSFWNLTILSMQVLFYKKIVSAVGCPLTTHWNTCALRLLVWESNDHIFIQSFQGMLIITP